MLLQKKIPAQPKAKECQQGITKPKLSPPRASATFISPGPEYLAERQRLGFSYLSQVVAQLSSTEAALPHTPGDAVLWQRESSRDPNLNRNNLSVLNPDVLRPPTHSNFALRSYQQCPASRKMPMAGGGACAGAGDRAFGLSTGGPWPPLCPVLK